MLEIDGLSVDENVNGAVREQDSVSEGETEDLAEGEAREKETLLEIDGLRVEENVNGAVRE